MRAGAGSAEWPYVTAAFPAAEGGLAVVGYFCAPVDLGDGVVFNDGCDAFIARYDGAGDLVRKKVLGGACSQSIGFAVALDGDLVVLVGSSQSPIDLGGEIVASESRFVLARLDGDDDSVAWARGFDLQFENSRNIGPQTLDFDGVGRLVMAGSASDGGSDFGDD